MSPVGLLRAVQPAAVGARPRRRRAGRHDGRIHRVAVLLRRAAGACRAAPGAGVAVCGRKRVARLMRAAGLAGICHRRKRPAPPGCRPLTRTWCSAGSWPTPRTGCGAPTSPSTPRATGKVYCCAVLDVFSRRIVGWSIADHIRSELVVDALQMATWRRRPEPGTIVHADRGAQYTSWVFGHRLREAGLLGSMGRVASSVDNTMIESFWSTMQRELLDTPALGQPRRTRLGDLRVDRGLVQPPPPAHQPRRCSPRTSSKPFTPPPTPRHDHTPNVSGKPGQAPLGAVSRLRGHAHKLRQPALRHVRIDQGRAEWVTRRLAPDSLDGHG